MKAIPNVEVFGEVIINKLDYDGDGKLTIDEFIWRTIGLIEVIELSHKITTELLFYNSRDYDQ